MNTTPSRLPRTIAIDGPAASGKSTLGEMLATRLGYFYFDTGLMYRAVAWEALRREVPIEDEAAVSELAKSLQINVSKPSTADGRQFTVTVDGLDITEEIRRPDVDANVSAVSAYPGVRQAMIEQQRRIAHQGPTIMAGRDIGTVVLPDADFKIYLDASVDERAHRRWLERQASGHDVSLDQLRDEIVRRDELDSSRAVAPLRRAADAILLDNTGLNAEETLERALTLVMDYANISAVRE